MTARPIGPLAGLVVLLGVGASATAGPRVAIIGDDAAAVAATRKAAPRGVEVVADIPADTTAAPTELAASHNLSAVLVIEVDHGKRSSSASATAYQGADGASLGTARASGKRKALAGKLAKAVWKRLGPAVRKAKGPGAGATPVAAAPTAAESTPPAPAWATARPGAEEATARPTPTTATTTTTGEGGLHASATPGRRGGPRMVELAVAGRPFWRRLRYRDDINDRLRPYDLAANAVGGAVLVRPVRALPGLHVTVGGELAVGVNGSRTSDMTAYATRASELTAAVGYGLGLAGAWVMAELGAGQQRFSVVDEMAGADELVPDVRYRFARAALAATVPLRPRLALTAGAGWRYLTDTGELESAAWFPRLTGQGLDAAAGVDYALTGWLTGFARVELRRYFFAMHPELGDTWITGGAVDQYLGASLGLQVRAL